MDSSLQNCGNDLASPLHRTFEALTGFWHGAHRLDKRNHMSGIADCFLGVALKLDGSQADDWELMNSELSSPLHLSRAK